ncbi:MAG: tyrosine-type recombinase/integrase [Gemmobacter sp.]
MVKSKSAPFTAKGVQAEREPGLHKDGGQRGLYLRVSTAGTKSWIVRTMMHGKRRDMGIGSLEHVGLAEARSKAQAALTVARNGGDPINDRKTEQAAALEAVRQAAQVQRETQERATRTFDWCVGQVYSKLLPGWRSARHGEIWLSAIQRHASPKIGESPIHTITRADVLDVLKPVAKATPESARRLRHSMGQVFAWAFGEGHCESNPVQAIGKLALPKVAKGLNRHAAMPWRDVPAFWWALDGREGVSALTLQFLILTAARSGEARGARWCEIDVEGKAWNIPGERMKAGLPHRVPLTDEALAVLKRAKGLDADFVFPSAQRAKDGSAKPQSDMVFAALFKRMRIESITTHGFRATFRTWAAESAKAHPEVAETALAHSVGNAVVKAYHRSDLFDARRDLMESWGRFVTGQTTARVVQLVRA